jgi:hypothetical protein
MVSVPVCEMFKETMPVFRENVLVLNFKCNIATLNFDEILRGFSQLQELEFKAWVGCFHLDTNDGPSSLRRLAIRHFTMDHGCSCTLNALQNLQHFRLDFVEGPKTFLSLERLLPTQSRTTLQSLTLGFYPCSCPIDYTSLDLFCSLTELEIEVASTSLFEYLPTTVLRLQVLKLHIKNLDALRQLVRVVESPPLAALKHLGVEIAIQGWGEDFGDNSEVTDSPEAWEAWEPAVAAIARLHVETLDVYGLLRPDFSTYFKNQCHHLQSLRWRVWEFYETSVDLAEASAAFTSALEHISPTPRVSIFECNLFSRWQVYFQEDLVRRL